MTTDHQPESAAEQPATIVNLQLRLGDMESRMDRLEDLLRHCCMLAEKSQHLSSILDPRTVQLMADVDQLRQALGDLDVLKTDLQRMAAQVWDEMAITRRISRIEDVLASRNDPPT